MQKTRKGLIAGVAVAFLATAFAFAGPLRGAGDEMVGGINLTGSACVSVCTSCHDRIAEGSSPGLIFDHGVHPGIQCYECHVRPAHEAGKIYRPPMETCFACHGLVHGPAGLVAGSACEDCHTPVFVLRPSWHIADWELEPHALAVGRGGSNRCILCHDAPADCDSCHLERSIDTSPVPPIYLRTVPLPPDLPEITVDVYGAATMGQCVFCHPNIDDGEWPDLIFTHDVHIARDYRCSACHESFPHSPGGTDVPDMLSCYRCHSLQHAARGEVATEDCYACHPQQFELVPPDHTPAFIAREHSDPAGERISECVMCHTSAFCAECHRGEKVLPDGTMSAQVIPADHKTAEWMPEHGGQFLGGQGACSICHTGESCARCHQTVMPHPTYWLARHTANGYPSDDCKVCHTERASCQECHHQGLRSTELVRENCVDCHEEMATIPATDIQDMRLVEHAVHFEVEERVGRPYICDDCHVGFTIARVRDYGIHTFETQAHDLRLCYDCHGNVDLRNIEIAPWPGSQLCRRCHTDMRL